MHPRSYPPVQVNKTHGVNLFYWFFESRSAPATDPLVVWLTGGPGCSSELALLQENGPFLINGTAEPVRNPYGEQLLHVECVISPLVMSEPGELVILLVSKHDA